VSHLLDTRIRCIYSISDENSGDGDGEIQRKKADPRSGGWGEIKGSKGTVGPAPFGGAARLEGDDEFSVVVRPGK
jgi:hypothetical protein